MKQLKIPIVLMFVLISCCLFTGCSEKTVVEQVRVYSYSGENEYFSICNGVIVLSEEQDIVYGGTLKEKGEKISHIATCSMSLHVLSNGEKDTLSSWIDVDRTNGSIQLSNPGSISGEISEKIKDLLASSLYFELEITKINGEIIKHTIEMNVTDVTAIFEK